MKPQLKKFEVAVGRQTVAHRLIELGAGRKIEAEGAKGTKVLTLEVTPAGQFVYEVGGRKENAIEIMQGLIDAKRNFVVRQPLSADDFIGLK
ncbi:MAG: hypothetical protein ACRC2U_01055 [Aeromonas sp.]